MLWVFHVPSAPQFRWKPATFCPGLHSSVSRLFTDKPWQVCHLITMHNHVDVPKLTRPQPVLKNHYYMLIVTVIVYCGVVRSPMWFFAASVDRPAVSCVMDPSANPTRLLTRVFLVIYRRQKISVSNIDSAGIRVNWKPAASHTYTKGGLVRRC